MKNIVAFTGSNSLHSINQQLLEIAIQKIQHDHVKLLYLADYKMPIYSPQLEEEGIPWPVRELFQMLTTADGYIVASPEHNGLPTALLKNAIDWLSRLDQRFFGDKPVMLLSTSGGGNGGASALQILASLMNKWGGNLIASYSLGNFYQKFDKSTQSINDSQEEEKLTHAVNQLMKSTVSLSNSLV